VSHLHEACGQNMLEEAPDEFEGIESDMPGTVAAFLAVDNNWGQPLIIGK